MLKAQHHPALAVLHEGVVGDAVHVASPTYAAISAVATGRTQIGPLAMPDVSPDERRGAPPAGSACGSAPGCPARRNRARSPRPRSLCRIFRSLVVANI